jgi:hypothetical protein
LIAYKLSEEVGVEALKILPPTTVSVAAAFGMDAGALVTQLTLIYVMFLITEKLTKWGYLLYKKCRKQN